MVFFGMTASGKSTLGQVWARQKQAVYCNTDRVRKELAGLQATDRRPDAVGQGIYSAAMTEQTYGVMLDQAAAAFARNIAMVVLDGSYSRRSDRDRVRQRAVLMEAACLFIFCTCSEAEVQRRLGLRVCDPEAVSDGRWEIFLHQQQVFERLGPDEQGDSLQLNTEQPIETMCTWLAGHPFFAERIPGI